VTRAILPSGLPTMKRFVDEGAFVFIKGRRDRELAKAVSEIGSYATGIQGDVSNLTDLDRLFAQIKQEKGRLEALFASGANVDRDNRWRIKSCLGQLGLLR
jgi:NAD(P)-dependent dehydrogenase (short-subunit alcohol dehydrogenase family)